MAPKEPIAPFFEPRGVAVVGVPDPLRTQAVKAFIVLHPGRKGDDSLKADIQTHVRQRLAAHEYPRKVEFVEALPLTATGKIIRRALRDGEKDPDDQKRRS